jgi:hypothetical protein
MLAQSTPIVTESAAGSTDDPLEFGPDPTPLQRYVAAYDRVRQVRLSQAEEQRRLQAARKAEQERKALLMLTDFIPVEVLADFHVTHLERHSAEAAEISLKPWFVLGVELHVFLGSTWWNGRNCVRVDRASQTGFHPTYQVIDKGATREDAESALAAAIWDEAQSP